MNNLLSAESVRKEMLPRAIPTTLFIWRASWGHLFGHLVLEDGGAVEHLHGDALPGLGVLRELDLGEGAFPDGASHLVLAHPPQRPATATATTPHHLRRAALPPFGGEKSREPCAEWSRGLGGAVGSCSGGRHHR